MIRGTVSARYEAIVRLRVRGPGGTEVEVDAVVDSGFTSSLTLPAATAAVLGLSPQSTGRATLADGSILRHDICAAQLSWGGTWRPVLVWVIGDQPLLGMRLLAGYQLRINVVPGGIVESLPLP